MNKAARTYVVQFGLSMGAYVVVLIASLQVLRLVALDLPWRVVVALAPVIPTLFALAAFLNFLRKMDELQRRIQLEALGFALGAVGILTFAYGFLENVGLPQMSYIWILPALVAFWGFGNIIANAHYR